MHKLLSLQANQSYRSVIGQWRAGFEFILVQHEYEGQFGWLVVKKLRDVYNIVRHSSLASFYEHSLVLPHNSGVVRHEYINKIPPLEITYLNLLWD